MVVYGEVLFIENCITGAVILFLTGRVRGLRMNKRRLTLAAVMCGIYAFILFLPMHWLAALTAKLLFSAAAVLTAFGVSAWPGLLKTAGAFYIISFLMGGVTIALMYVTKMPFLASNGSFLFKGAAFFQIAAGVTVTWWLGSWLAEMLREKRQKEKVLREVKIYIGGKCWKMEALVDTGNSLREPVTGMPVAVLSESAGKMICGSLGNEIWKRIFLIPYSSVGSGGVLQGIRPDKIAVGEMVTGEVILAIGKKDFSPWKGCEKYDMLLHQQLLEGEDE